MRRAKEENPPPPAAATRAVSGAVARGRRPAWELRRWSRSPSWGRAAPALLAAPRYLPRRGSSRLRSREGELGSGGVTNPPGRGGRWDAVPSSALGSLGVNALPGGAGGVGERRMFWNKFGFLFFFSLVAFVAGDVRGTRTARGRVLLSPRPGRSGARQARTRVGPPGRA